MHGGEMVYAAGFGIANLDTGAEVDVDTVFQLASVSKPIGATVIAEVGGPPRELDWDTRVAEWLPGFALADPWVTEHLTIGDLYSHRSGLPDHAGDDLASLGVDRDTILERLRYLPLSQFRSSYAYTNFGVMAGALAATEVVRAAAPRSADADWYSMSAQQIYTPLGMDRTTSRYADYLAMDNHAVGHTNWGGTWIVHPDPIDDDIATAAGGVASSASDVARWLQFVLASGTDELVDQDLLLAALTPQTLMPVDPPNPAAPRGGYGFGFQTGMFTGTSNAFISHSGAFAQGAGTMIALIPALDLGVVALTNGYPVGLAETIAMETLDYAQHGRLSLDWWPLYRDAIAHSAANFDSIVVGDPQADAPGAGDLDAYVAAYRSDYFGEARVTRGGDRLELRISPTPTTGQSWELEPWGKDTFRVLLDNEDASPDAVSAVRIDPVARTLWFEYFDSTSGGTGTFTRVGP